MEIRALLNSMTEHLANEERRVTFLKLKGFVESSLNQISEDLDEQNTSLNKRIDDLDLVTTHENTINRASINGLDLKYEQALEEVAESIDKYIGIVNETANKQYDDFNKNLKTEFSKNLEQIQDILNNLRDEIDGQKEKVITIETNINDLEYNNKKEVDEVKERIEIERLVNELVSWISEENEIQKHESIVNDNKQLEYQVQETDKKADDALEGIKGLEGKRELDIQAKKDRKEQKAKQKEEKVI